MWLAGQPLVLASRSKTRYALLAAAGIPLEVRPAEVDERALEAQAERRAAGEIAALLARAKARAVAQRMPGRLVLGADQTLALGQQLFSKPADQAAARAQLRALRGRTHELHSALAVARDDEMLFEYGDAARLTMRAFSEAFLEGYLAAAGPVDGVGGYRLEGVGIQLFERIEGDYFTILGLPLLPLLAWLRRQGVLAA